MIQSPLLEILVATRNQGKIREIQQALRFSPIKLRYLDEFSNVLSVDEVGWTYQENAIRKALGYSRQTGVCSLADDSGLEVDALGGMPGIFSARFGGDNASDTRRIESLLTELSRHPDKERTARFICCMALAGWQSQGEPVNTANPQLLALTEGSCEGTVAPSPRGLNGFGFDPVFVPRNYDATFAELPAEIKNNISHRAVAVTSMQAFLDHWLAQT